MANIFCASFRASTAKKASVHIACLLLINMMPVYFGFHSSLIRDLLGVSLATYRLFHASTGTLAVLLYVLIDVTGRSSFNVGNPLQMSGLIVSVATSDKSALPIFPLRQLYHFDYCPMKFSYAVTKHQLSSSLMPFRDMFLLS